jgi:hypothetical protein
LILGRFGGESIAYEYFIESTREMENIVQHNGDIDYDEDDDEVLRRTFEDYFLPCENLLELSQSALPSWLSEINDGKTPLSSWSLDSAINAALAEAWGLVVWNEKSIAVGDADGTEISRKCWIASKQAE